MSVQCLGHHPTPTHQHQFNPHSISSAHCPYLTFVFSPAPCMFTSHIGTSLSYRDLRRAWHRLKSSPPQYITTLPQRPHSTLLLSKGYPSALEPNSSHVLRERSTELHGASPEKAPRLPPPTGPKNATNYWGSLRWRLSFNPWQVLLRIWIDISWYLGWWGKYILFGMCLVASMFC